MGHVTYTPRTLAPRLPDVCEKNQAFSQDFESGSPNFLWEAEAS